MSEMLTTTLIWMAAAGPLETVVLASISLWFAFYVVNHAEVTRKVRAGLLPALPGWITDLIECPICASFWALTAFTLLVGYTPLMWVCPPIVLLLDLIYRRLSGKGCA